jgi:hypothetical protein
VAGLKNVLKRVDGWANGSGIQRGGGSGSRVQDKLRALQIRRSVGSLAEIRRKRGVCIGDYDALAKVAVSSFMKNSDLGMRDIGRADHVKAGDASIEPEAGEGRHIGVGDLRVKIEQDTDIVAACFVDEVVEIVEGAVCGIDGLGVGEVELNGGKEECVDAEGVEIVETLSYAVKAAAVGGTEVGWVYVVDDGVLPPQVGTHPGADPTRTGEGLCRSDRVKGADEKQSEESEGGLGHTLVLEMLPEKPEVRH